MNKAIIVPILSAVALIVKKACGYEIGSDEINILADGVLAAIAFVGILMNPKK